ncbi:MAG: arginine--tRNA ligase [Nanoarchaeota archaeon]|nr:arginine--tRNA ligase [Nanoarchaeota archaeon]
MKQLIAKLIAKEANLKPEDVENLLETPPSPELGDYAFPCFILASKLRESPLNAAAELSTKISKTPEIEKIEAKGPYVNFFLNKKLFAEKILGITEEFGRTQQVKSENVMIEFSQANTHKAFHIGHIRGTSLGESLARILEFTGNKVLRANYQGDTGMHVAKWLWCYKKYHKKEKLIQDGRWIAKIYVDAVKKLSKHENFQKQVDEINRSLEEGKDKSLTELWKKTRELSLNELEKIYTDLGTRFDYYFFESEVEKRAKEIAKSLVKKEIAKISEGAAIINLEKYNLGVWVLLRSDGTVLYSAKDIALAERKFSKLKVDKSIYVVGAAQRLHILQLFKTLELMKFPQAKNCSYVPVSEVRLPSGKMSSRTGENIIYEDFRQEILDYSTQEIKKRYPKLSQSEINSRALNISIAAIKFSMLKQDLDKTIIFEKEKALNFEGDTGPYLQYSYARASSILRKAKYKPKLNIKINQIQQQELSLIKEILKFPEQVENASKNLTPSTIANYSLQLAKLFNEFYHSCPVLDSEEKAFRLEMVSKFRQVMKQSLYLLGIQVLEEM